MDNLLVYTIPGIPTPLLRARHSLKGNRIYNPQHAQQHVARINLEEQHKNTPLFDGPLHIDIIFYMPITKSNESQKNKVKPRQLA